MATHSGILDWRIPWTEEPGWLQSRGSQESDTTERLSVHTHAQCCSAPSPPERYLRFTRDSVGGAETENSERS